MSQKKVRKKLPVRNLTVTAMLSAVATVLMYLSFSVPLVPSFLKMDLSELPALIGSFALGPWYGVAVCLIKNLFNLLRTSTGGIGELSNFLLGSMFVFAAGEFYRRDHSKKGAVAGALIGAVCMACFSLLTNYFLVYPVYFNFMPKETILNMYQAILPSVDTLFKALLIFNVPFTFVKGLLSVVICLLVYKRLSPILKKKN